MKKLISLILFCMLLVTVLILPVRARSGQVMDYAILMSQQEVLSLEKSISGLQSNYALDVVLLTVPSLMGKSAQDFADDFYDNNRYGPDGLLFLLDMGGLQWHISTHGTAIDMISDRDLAEIEDRVIHYFSNHHYYEGFHTFLNILPGYLENNNDHGIQLLPAIIIGAAISRIVVLVMRSSMNTKKSQKSAISYEVEGSYQLRTQQDLFLYSNISKREKPRNESGSTTHRSASGRSHGGRGGRF